MQVTPGVGLFAAQLPHWMSSSQTTEGSLLHVPTPLFAHWESVEQESPAGVEHTPGAMLARPRRSIVLRIDAPNCEKSQLRPSIPPSGWQLMQATYEASCDVLTTAPTGSRTSGSSKLKRGAAAPRPIPFGTLASRAAVWNRILPSSSCGGSGSGLTIDGTTAITRGAQPLQSRRLWQALPFGQKYESVFTTVTLRDRKF